MNDPNEAMLHPYGSKVSVDNLTREVNCLKRGIMFMLTLVFAVLGLGLVCLRNMRGNGMLEADPLLAVGEGAITTEYLADGSVTSLQLANYSVHTHHFAAAAVTQKAVEFGAIQSKHIKKQAINTDKLNLFTSSVGLRSPNVPQMLFGGSSSSTLHKDFCRLDAADRPICLDTSGGSLRMLRCKDHLCYAGYEEVTVPLTKFINILDFQLIGSEYPGDPLSSIVSTIPVIVFTTHQGVSIVQCTDALCEKLGSASTLLWDTFQTGSCYAKLGSTDSPAYFSFVASDGALTYTHGICGPVYSAQNYRVTCNVLSSGTLASYGLGQNFALSPAGQYTATAGFYKQNDKGQGLTVALWDSSSNAGPRFLKYVPATDVNKYVPATDVNKVYDVLCYKDINQYDEELLRIRVTYRVGSDSGKVSYLNPDIGQEAGAFVTQALTLTYNLDKQQLLDETFTEEMSKHPFGMVSLVAQDMVPIQVGQLVNDDDDATVSSTGTKLVFYYGKPRAAEYSMNRQYSNLLGLRYGTSSTVLDPSFHLTVDGFPVVFYTLGDNTAGPLYMTRCTNKLCQVHLN
eukprot:g42562.t1